MHELVIKAWRHYFLILKDDLAVRDPTANCVFVMLTPFQQKAQGNISFTSDIWTDKNLRRFLALTAHWVTKGDQPGTLKLKAGLLAFHHFPGSHTGLNMAKTILHLLDHAEVTHKVHTT